MEKQETGGGKRRGTAAEKRIKRAGMYLCLLLCMTLLVACGQGSRIVFTTGFGENEVFRIGDARCTKAEIMVYLTNEQNRYESVFGEAIWDVSQGDVTMEDNVKDIVLAKIAQIKTMCLLAKSRNLSLTKEEKSRARAAAAEYFGALNEAEVSLMGLTEKGTMALYEEYALANKLYENIIQNINPEISDDEARTITVQHILLRTYTTDGSGTRIEYEDDVKQSVYEKAWDIYQMAVEEGMDFTELASRYSNDGNITYSFGKGEMPAAFEEAAFSLATGEISTVVETESGYHLIKCINTFDREQTDLSKIRIVEERRKEVFGEEYDAFADTLVRQLNTKLWESISLIRDAKRSDVDFFEIYDKYWGLEKF